MGTVQSTRGNTRYYKCSQCGHTWTARIEPVRVVAVESRKVELEER